MYAAPLNFDRFFKKVFSEVNIAKKFLEDFFDVDIEEIERMPVKHKLTDAAAVVEFDFRCKIKGKYIIIDMQQAYKRDVMKRFYVYHALNTGMQLETLPKIVAMTTSGKKYEVKSYDGIVPAVTLIWMANDTFNLDLETLTFYLSPEQLTDFIKNDALWASKDVEKIWKIREELLALLNNDTKELGFLSENKFIYAFQRNIVKSQKFHKYKVWFDFAETTLNPDNTKEDFEKFKNNQSLMEVLERIKTDTLDEEELSLVDEYEISFRELAEYREYLSEYRDYLFGPFKEEMTQRHLRDLRQQAFREAKEEVREEVAKEVEMTKEKTILSAHQQGLDNALIATITQLSMEKINEIIEKNKDIKGE